MKRSAFQRFMGELRRRRVPQTAAVYLVAAWAAIEFSDVVVPNLDGPQWVVKAVIVAAGVGLPVVLVLAWVFDWGPEGLHRTTAEDGPLGEGGPATGPGPVEATRTSPWLAVIAVLVVGIGSALGVAALLEGERDEADPTMQERSREAREGRAPEPPPLPGIGPGYADSLRRSIEEGLRGLTDPAALEALGRLGALEGMGGADSVVSADLAEVARIVAEEADLAVLLQGPPQWRLHGRSPVPLPRGDTLMIRGVAQDTAGGAVTAVEVDGRVVAEAEEGVDVLPFETEIVGTAGEGRRTVVVVVRTVDGREIRREYPIQQIPARP